jgi:hypothetical protein
VEENKAAFTASSTLFSLFGLVMGSGAGVAFMNLLQLLIFMMLLNVDLPQNFYDFLSLFNINLLDIVPNPLETLIDSIDFEREKFIPPPKFVDQGIKTSLLLVNNGQLIIAMIFILILMGIARVVYK